MNVYLKLYRYKILQKEHHYYFYINCFDQNHNVLPKMKYFVHITIINVPSILHIIGKSTCNIKGLNVAGLLSTR